MRQPPSSNARNLVNDVPNIITVIRELDINHQRSVVRAGSPVLSQGEASTRIFVVLSGILRQTHITHDGTAFITKFLGNGDLFGKNSLQKRSTRGFIVAEQNCHLLHFSKHNFNQILMESERFSNSFNEYLIHENNELYARLLASSKGSVEDQLALTLWFMQDKFGLVQEDCIELPMKLTCQTLSEMLGHSRQSIGNALCCLENKRIISSHYGRVEILDVDALYCEICSYLEIGTTLSRT